MDALVVPSGHSDWGLSVMVVSIISTGAGSVAVSARPSLPATEATAGCSLITRSCQDMIRFTSVREVAGNSTGMKSSEPSSRVGMNSLPNPWVWRASDSGRSALTCLGSPKATTRQTPRSAAAIPSTVARWASAQSSAGS
jgi:hypothetical protein